MLAPLTWQRGDRAGVAWCLEGLAGVAGATGQPERAARLFGVSTALRDAIGTPLPPAERISYERSMTDVRAQLGEAAFAAAWAEGRATPLE